jgi:superoxide reductase
MKQGINMAVEFYRCEVCGNMVALIKKGGGTLVCCGQDMTKLEANTTDAAQEKHVPVVTKESATIKAVIGSVMHPMLREHHIEWIALVADGKVEFKFLKLNEEPKAEFNRVASGEIYEYCNLHGLWKSSF